MKFFFNLQSIAFFSMVVVDPKGAFGGDLAMAPKEAPKDDLGPTPWQVVQAEKEDVVKAAFEANPAKAAEVVDQVVEGLGEEFVAENGELVDEVVKAEMEELKKNEGGIRG
mmetsp:Transcript_44415/g.48076  ORF Transcript_44415/g.48076 Transcript_44415/m.48076 type:complete len:111 (-) Transcript_44415:168-500(-)